MLLRGIPDATYAAAAVPAHVGRGGGVLPAPVGPPIRRVRGATTGCDLPGVVPHGHQLREAALQAVGEILQTPPMARTHVKRMLNERYGLIDYQTMFWALEESDEPREGMRAFMEKRPPSWVPEEFA